MQVEGPVSFGHGSYYAPLALIDGFPPIAFQSGSPQQISYVRATNASGSEWGFATSLFADTAAGFHLHLQDREGLPVLVYDTGDTDKSIRRVGLNADGEGWGDETVIYNSSPEDGNPGSAPLGFAMPDGIPLVLEDQYNATRFVLVRAGDSSGGSWAEAEHVSFAQEFSGSSNLSMINGQARFVSVSGGQLVFNQRQQSAGEGPGGCAACTDGAIVRAEYVCEVRYASHPPAGFPDRRTVHLPGRLRTCPGQ